ncbi:MAG: DUF5067 domain-containing protein [Clostridia bacterium]|nr:DUF5067 domain-containing protein [Clostridia bacterium]
MRSIRWSLLTALAVVCLLWGCKGSATYTNAGFYTLSEHQGDNDAMGNALGYVYLYLSEDGTGVLRMGYDDDRTVSWQDGSMKVAGKKVSFTPRNEVGFLTLKVDGKKLQFTYRGNTSPLYPDLSDMKVIGAQAITDMQGKDVVRLYFEWTNQTDAPISFSEARAQGLQLSVSQNYIYLSEVSESQLGQPQGFNHPQMEVLPGASVCLAKNYYYDSKGTPVHVELTRVQVKDNAIFPAEQTQITIQPEQIQPAFTYAYGTHGYQFEGYGLSGATQNIRASIDGYEVKDNRLYVTFTAENLTEEEKFAFNSFIWPYDRLEILAYQNGIQLPMSNISEAEAAAQENLYGSSFGCVFTPHTPYTFVVAWDIALERSGPVELVLFDTFGMKSITDNGNRTPFAAAHYFE